MRLPSKRIDRSPLVPTQKIDPFDKHLKFPESKLATNKKRSETLKFPMAISSEKWRINLLCKKEEKSGKVKDKQVIQEEENRWKANKFEAKTKT